MDPQQQQWPAQDQNQNQNADFYLQPIQYDVQMDNQIQIQLQQPVRNVSQESQPFQNQKQNPQCQLNDLLKRIYKQTKIISQMTGLNLNYAILLYYHSKWNQDLCTQYTLGGLKQKSNIGYLEKDMEYQQGSAELSTCQVCQCQQVYLFRNICGHLFCTNCWIDYMLYKFKQSHYDPFPLCMQQQCKIRISRTLCQILCQINYVLNDRFNDVLCRSYAKWNNKVKVCKGSTNKQCNRCFLINKMYGVIECDNCRNLVCPRCGQRSHGSTNCQQITKWKLLGQTTMGLIQYYQYQKCPNCKMIVQRSSGCNQIKCRCGVTFCYVCGQKWQPNHHNGTNEGDYCPNYKKLIKIYRQRKQRRKRNIIKFCFNIQSKRSQIITVQDMYNMVDSFLSQLKGIYSVFKIKFLFHQSELKILQSYALIVKKTFCVLWGQHLHQYFNFDESRYFFFVRLRQQIAKIYKFMFQCILPMYRILIKTQQLTLKELDIVSQQNMKKFYTNFFQKTKSLSLTKQTINKIAISQFQFQIVDDN